jgi:hypothetical protein
MPGGTALDFAGAGLAGADDEEVEEDDDALSLFGSLERQPPRANAAMTASGTARIGITEFIVGTMRTPCFD